MFIRAIIKDKESGEEKEVKVETKKSNLTYPSGGKWENFKFFIATNILLAKFGIKLFWKKLRKYDSEKYGILKVQSDNGFILNFFQKKDVPVEFIPEGEPVEIKA